VQNLSDSIRRVTQMLADRLSDNADDVAVSGVVVFTHPQAKPRLEGCGVQATTAKNLKGQLRGVGKGGLSNQQLARIRDVLAAGQAR